MMRASCWHCSNEDVERSSGNQTIDPCPEATVTPSGEPDQRSGAVHQLSAQIAVTPLADAEPFSATGRVLVLRPKAQRVVVCPELM